LSDRDAPVSVIAISEMSHLRNLTCLISAIEELGVEAEFSRLVMP
jgi:hypothetical protein